MNLSITLKNIEPMSLNHYSKITTRGRFASKYKPAKSKEFDDAVIEQLDLYQRSIFEFNSMYKPDSHYLLAEYRFYYPIFTSKGLISQKSKDVDNIIKPIQDLIFKYISPDDSQIVSVSSTKIHSDDIKIIATYQIRNLHDII